MAYSPRDELLSCLREAAAVIAEARINAETLRRETGFEWYPICAVVTELAGIGTRLDILTQAGLFQANALAYGSRVQL